MLILEGTLSVTQGALVLPFPAKAGLVRGFVVTMIQDENAVW
jgi:hypothetical protein